MKRTKQLIALLTMLTMLSVSVLPSCVFADDERTPVSIGKPVTVSIPALVTQLAKENIVDGDITNNRFATSTTPSKPLVVTINLEQVYDVDEIEIVERTVTAPTCADDVTIELGLTTPVTTLWNTVVSGAALTRDNRIPEHHLGVNNFAFESAMCDTVRITFNKTDGNFIQFQINEISVFGEENTNPQYPENLVQGKAPTASHPALNSVLAVSNMTDGDTTTRFASYVNDINSPLVVTIDLEGLYKIDYAEIVEYYNNGSTCSELTDIDVGYTDENGTTLWRHFVSDAPLATKNGVGALRNPFRANPVVGDKIRFVFDGSPNGYVQYGIVELIVFGEPAEMPSYEIGAASVTRDDELLSTLTSGDAVFEAELPYLVNDDETSTDFEIYCGIYDNDTNEMKWGRTAMAKAGGEEKIRISLTIGENWENCSPKVFVTKTAHTVSPNTVEASIDYEKSVVTVSGSAEEGSTVTLISYKDDNDGLAPNYYNEFEADGDYVYSYVMSGEKGDYLVRAVTDGVVYKADKFIGFYTNDDLNSIAKTDFSGADATKVKELICETYGTLFDPKGADSEKIAAYMAKDMEINGDYDTKEEMFASFSQGIGFANFEALADAEKTADAIVNDKTLPFESLSAYKAFCENLGDEQKAEVCEKLLDTDAAHFNDYIPVFCEAVILSAIYNADNWTYIKPILTDNRAELALIDYDEYDALCDDNKNSDVDKEITGREFPTLASLCNAVNDAIENAIMQDYYQSRTPNRGGGGGGGGKGGGGVVPIVSGNAQVSDNPQPPATQPEAFESSFDDMSDVSWAKTAVDTLCSKGIINGRSDKIFDPHSSVTREEFVKMAVGAMGLGTSDYNLPFTDVQKSDWFYPYLAKAYESGIISGISDSEFGKGSLIKREDMAVIMCRILGESLNTADYGASFADSAEIAPYASESVNKLFASGIINGTGDGRFAPKDACTRAQAAVMIYNVIKYKEGK